MGGWCTCTALQLGGVFPGAALAPATSLPALHACQRRSKSRGTHVAGFQPFHFEPNTPCTHVWLSKSVFHGNLRLLLAALALHRRLGHLLEGRARLGAGGSRVGGGGGGSVAETGATLGRHPPPPLPPGAERHKADVAQGAHPVAPPPVRTRKTAGKQAVQRGREGTFGAHLYGKVVALWVDARVVQGVHVQVGGACRQAAGQRGSVFRGMSRGRGRGARRGRVCAEAARTPTQ